MRWSAGRHKEPSQCEARGDGHAPMRESIDIAPQTFPCCFTYLFTSFFPSRAYLVPRPQTGGRANLVVVSAVSRHAPVSSCSVTVRLAAAAAATSRSKAHATTTDTTGGRTHTRNTTTTHTRRKGGGRKHTLPSNSYPRCSSALAAWWRGPLVDCDASLRATPSACSHWCYSPSAPAPMPPSHP